MNYINSASLIASLIDYSDVGDIKHFINEESIEQLQITLNKQGYFDGQYLFNGFSILRSNDLIWSFVINNYLLGRAPPDFDILYWNAVVTNLPAQMCIYYLRNMYVKNLLIKPDALNLLGTNIDISKIDIPMFFLAAIDDHIVPWRSVYKGMQSIQSKNKIFCLTDSGHVAGVVNPPYRKKYHHRINYNINSDSDEWLQNSIKIDYSWWLVWFKWLGSKSGKLNNDNIYNETISLKPAPGDYIKNKFS